MISYKWARISILDRISSLFPCKARDYVCKWMHICGTVKNVVVQSGEDRCPVRIKFEFVFSTGFKMHTYDVSVYECSIRHAWKKCLDMIASIENMRNVEELLIWIDMKDI